MDIYVRVIYNNGFEPTRQHLLTGANMEGARKLFESSCRLVEACGHKHVARIEVKNGRKHLFSQNFADGKRV